MREPNEEIVRRYLELDGYFVRSNVQYRFATPSGSGWSDVDLCAINPITGDSLAVEVKGWHGEAITPGSFKSWPSLLYFTRAEATEAIVNLLGSDQFRRVLVVGAISPNSRTAVTATAAGHGIELWEFSSILRRLIAATPVGPSAGSDADHMIRLLKVYRFLGPEGGA